MKPILFNLRKIIIELPSIWFTFRFEVLYSNKGVARIYIGNRMTKYHAGGHGYDKESSVIAQMINDITENIKYNKNIYGNDGKKLCQGGCGFDSIAKSFNSIKGNKLEKLYSGYKNDVYEITINKKYIIKE